MKKIYFAAVAVLLAILIAGCDDGITAPLAKASSVVGYTDDGQPLVGLNVKVKSGGGRALTDTLAKAGVDFYEVIFTNFAGTTIYRTSWRGDTAEGRLTVPAGIYDNGATPNGKAYMAAGRRDTKTLLAVGVLDSADGGGGAKEIDAATTTVTFALTALTTNIAASVTPSFTAVYGSGPSTVTAATITVDKKDYPVFLFPQSTNDIVGTFTIGGVLFGAGLTHQNSIKVAKATPTTLVPKITSKGFIWKEGDEQLAELVTATFAGLAVDSAVTNSFTMNITTPAAPNGGLGLLSFEIPVYLFSDINGSTASHTTWYIRGGINNQLPDAGGTTNSLGGSIIYGVGDVLGGAGLLMNPQLP
jgi:hypothetical protein